MILVQGAGPSGRTIWHVQEGERHGSSIYPRLVREGPCTRREERANIYKERRRGHEKQRGAQTEQERQGHEKKQGRQ